MMQIIVYCEESVKKKTRLRLLYLYQQMKVCLYSSYYRFFSHPSHFCAWILFIRHWCGGVIKVICSSQNWSSIVNALGWIHWWFLYNCCTIKHKRYQGQQRWGKSYRKMQSWQYELKKVLHHYCFVDPVIEFTWSQYGYHSALVIFPQYRGPCVKVTIYCLTHSSMHAAVVAWL